MKKQTIFVRKAQPEDAADIARVHVEAWRAAYRGLLPENLLANLSIERRKNWWDSVLASTNPKSKVVVAFLEDKLVGFARVGPARDVALSKNWGELEAIYLLEEAWGIGLGWQMWQAVYEFLVSAEYETFMLWVLDGNERAIQFYEKVGFVLDPSPEGLKLEQMGSVTVREHRYVYAGLNP